MLLQQVAGATFYPVSVAEAKAQAIVDYTDDDALVGRLVATASRMVGEMAGRVLSEETWALSVPAGLSGDLVLPKSPVQSVSSITYYDADDVEQSATVGDFYLIKDEDIAFLRPKVGTTWPTANSNRSDAITVTFVAGYEVCPETLRHAVLMLVGHLYKHREAVSGDGLIEVPLGVQAQISLERRGWVGA